jgi:alpha-tubulin suppressor-like RCC1 family protein
VTVAAGTEHVCAFLDSHGTVCWGGNQQGQLGVGRPTTPLGDAAGEVEALGEIDLGTP